ncbi:MAG: ABC transporter ATP-binding protein [Deinococcota bacterium]
MTTIVSAKDLQAYYVTNAYGVARTVKAVDNISIDIQEGEVYGLAGESGCGKSTLLKVLLGDIQQPLRILGGSVHYQLDGELQDAATMTEEAKRGIRWRQVSYIPQGSMHVLNPVRRIQNTFHDFITTHKQTTKRESKEMTQRYLRDLGLPEKVMRSYPHQLSGGMRQRVTIALATILWPKLIFADEPTTALDVVVQRGVIQLLKDIQHKENSTVVLITHDLGVHANLADRIGVLYAGKLVEEAATKTILKSPQHPYTKYLIHSLPSFDGHHAKESIPGRPPALDKPPQGCRFHPRCPLAISKCEHEEPPMLELAPGHRAACHLLTASSSS